MQCRVVFLFLIVLLSTSCQFFKLDKKANLQEVDTIIDFSSVDVSPSFKVCDSIIDKVAKTNCFRSTIHKHIFESLAGYQLETSRPIDEVIQVEVVIDNKGKAIAHKIVISDSLKTAIPKIDSLIRVSLLSMPKLFPATKRGIPVATQYQIPIHIRVK
jgi:hypothetical protein